MMKKLFAVLVVLCVAFTCAHGYFLKKKVGAAAGGGGAFADGYAYRKSIPITGATGASTDYQISMTVNSGSGADSAGVVYLNGHAPAFPADIAFYDDSSSTRLSYWAEDATTYWVKVADNLASNQSIYLYYGYSSDNDARLAFSGSWVKYGSNPVMSDGAGAAWDNLWVLFHSIEKIDNTYYGYYQGSTDTIVWGIGRATSSDGIAWTKDGGNPVVTVGAGSAWDNQAVLSPTVWKEGSTWYMVYAGRNSSTAPWKIGLASSEDGIAWTKDGGNPVMDVGGAGTWDNAGVVPGTRVFLESGTYYLYYWGYTNGSDYSTWKIGLATSTNRTSWTKSGSNPVLVGGGTDAWNVGVIDPHVKKIGTTYHMWYQGNDTNVADVTAIGHATSTDKTTWTKDTSNPVVPRTAAAWDSIWVESPVLVFDNTNWRVYYGGGNDSAGDPRMRVGYATWTLTGSSGDNTFLFFDDFEDASVNSAKWTNTGTFTESSGSVSKYASNTNASYVLVGKTSIAHPVVTRARTKVGTDWSNEYGWEMVLLWDSAWATSGYLAGHYKDVSSDYSKLFLFPGGTGNQTNEGISANTWYKYDLFVNETNQYFKINGTQKGALTTTPPAASRPVVLGTSRTEASSVYTTYFDYAFARKWTTSGTEPAVGTPGAEETP